MEADLIELTMNGQQNHNLDNQHPGPETTNFEEKATFKEHLESDDEDNQQAIKAKATAAPKQPTQQEVQEQPDPHALSQLVSHLRSRQGQKYITSTTNKPKAHHSGRLRLPQRI